ncbi:HAD family hydrolase [Promicromonospora sp. NPDC023987]|uniref:HAD family hydrolase n=1 Tax=Promicromonospora sp. NPDC023987 TaxID=3155360 RepID=UPI0033EF646A
MAGGAEGKFRAVVFDLFGTLVLAPTADDRSSAAAVLAAAAERPVADVVGYLRESWRVRHDGTLTTVKQLSTHLLAEVGGDAFNLGAVMGAWRHLAPRRLRADQTVLAALDALSGAGLAMGLLSDASAEIVEAWAPTDLASRFGSAVFSCAAAAIKPDEALYQRTLCELDAVDADTVLYVGDGGGDELRGAERLGLTAVRVRRRGGEAALSFGEHNGWNGQTLPDVEAVPSWIGEQR